MTRAVATKAEYTVAGIGSEAVRAKTGKGWDEWLSALDGEGAAKMTHKEIVAVLADRYGLGSWWRQMVTVGYEQERGLRVKYQRPKGFTVNVSRTIKAPLDPCYALFATARGRKKWLGEVTLEPKSSTPGKVCRFLHGDGGGNVEIRFAAKGDEKTSVAVEVSNLEREQDVERMRTLWAALLDRAKSVLTSGRG
jgi:uncharacterized protein YndB with AHSA1/START domain